MTFGQTMVFGIVMMVLWWGLKTVYTFVSWTLEVLLPFERDKLAEKHKSQKPVTNNYKGDPGKKTIGFNSMTITDKEE